MKFQVNKDSLILILEKEAAVIVS